VVGGNVSGARVNGTVAGDVVGSVVGRRVGVVGASVSLPPLPTWWWLCFVVKENCECLMTPADDR
jgi:hypothetical protein